MVKALKHNDYSAGDSDYTPSSMSRPAYMTKLLFENNDKLVSDVADKFFALEGHVVHSIIDKFADNNNLTEKRLYAQVGKWKIGAQFDNMVLDEGILQDYKNTTIYKFKKDYKGNWPDAPDWDAQLNINAYLARKNGYDIKQIEIIGLLKDFSKSQAKYNKEYPNAPIVKRPFKLWSDAEVESHIINKCTLQENPNPPPCSKEDTWATDDVYKLMKKGRKTSVRNMEDKFQLLMYAFSKKYAVQDGVDIDNEPVIKLNPGFSIVKVKGERKRCQDYCTVGMCNLCPDFEKFKKEQGE